MGQVTPPEQAETLDTAERWSIVGHQGSRRSRRGKDDSIVVEREENEQVSG